MEQIFMALIDKLDAFYAFLTVLALIIVWAILKILKDTRKRVELRTLQLSEIENEQKRQAEQLRKMERTISEVFTRLGKLTSKLSELIGKCNAIHK